MTERQKFQVIQKYDRFEVRRYERCVIAEMEINRDYSSATSAAFRDLFHYISKGNQKSQSIAMTAPVIAATDHSMDSEEWRVAFVMPDGSKLGDLPVPSDSKVRLVDLPPQDCVALPFKGRATQKLSELKEQELRALAAKVGLQLSSEIRINRFDPPFKPWFLMYNEIVIPLRQQA